MAESKVENTKKESMETTKRGKLAKLAGFELEMKKDSLVPKDTNFSVKRSTIKNVISKDLFFIFELSLCVIKLI